jgi:RHS repeat-associated protein
MSESSPENLQERKSITERSCIAVDELLSLMVHALVPLRSEASGIECIATVDRMAYDPWGDRRFASTTVGASDPTNAIQPASTNRGYTGHEMLDQGNLGLIHMNGRLYDPTLARFVSADPFVQDPHATQSLNRYAYVWNDPLNSTDPSGYFKFLGINIDLRTIAGIAVAAFTGGAVSAWIIDGAYAAGPITAAHLAGVTMTAGIAGGAAAGFTGSMVMTKGNVNASLKGAVVGAAFGGLGAYGATNNLDALQMTAANAALGGTAAKLQGGSFADGFKLSGISAGASEAYRYMVGRYSDPLPGENRAYPFYTPNPDTGEQYPIDSRLNVIGNNGPGFFCSQGTLCSRALNLVPGINATAGLHDFFFNMRNHPEFTTVNNVGTMLPAAALTYAGLLRGALSVQLAIEKK